jgi:hypothetical protein
MSPFVRRGDIINVLVVLINVCRLLISFCKVLSPSSFDKYVLEFTSKSFVKKIFEKLILPHVCTNKFDLTDVWKKWFSTDMKKKSYQAWKSQPRNPPLCYKMVALLPMNVVIYHKLRIQQFHENRLIILQEII